MIRHPFPPLYDEIKNTHIGIFSVRKVQRAAVFLRSSQNRFWKVTSAVFGVKTPNTIQEKKDFLLSCNIALWDVITSCDIQGSSDSSIRDVTANDLSPILSNSKVERIFTNGKTADKFYKKYTFKTTGIQATCLPSTSPANAAWSVEKLTEAWKIICTDS